jgi:hypothetical protein
MKIILFSIFIFFASCSRGDTDFWGSYNQVDIIITNDTNDNIRGSKIYFQNNSLPTFDEILIDLKQSQEIKLSYNLMRLRTLSEGSVYLKIPNKTEDTYLFFFEARGSYNNKISIKILQDNVVTVKQERIPK